MNRPRIPAIPRLARVPCLPAKALAAPVNSAVAPVLVPEASTLAVPLGVAVSSEPPDDECSDGVTLSGARAARWVKLSIVRDLFCAGLFGGCEHMNGLYIAQCKRETHGLITPTMPA
jgi:hypothetical protein